MEQFWLEHIDHFSFSSEIEVFNNIFLKQNIAHVTPHLVLSNHSMVFVYVSSPRSYFASRPYNYSLCGVLGRKTWKAYLECLYCKVKSWIHRGKQHTNMIKVCKCVDTSGRLTAQRHSPNLDDWDHGLSLMLIIFLLNIFFTHLSLFYHLF
jgi:hypothetical protein